jgi:hypothetical protein
MTASPISPSKPARHSRIKRDFSPMRMNLVIQPPDDPLPAQPVSSVKLLSGHKMAAER